MKNDIEKIVEGIKFVGTIAMVFMIGFAFLSFTSEMWKYLLIALPIVYIFYKWLGATLTGIVLLGATLIYILLPILLSP